MKAALLYCMLCCLQLRKRIEDKNRLLRQLAASMGTSGLSSSSSLSPIDLSGLSERWDGFVGQLQAYDTNLESQRQGLQLQLAKRIEDFSGTIAGFGSRYVQLRQVDSVPVVADPGSLHLNTAGVQLLLNMAVARPHACPLQSFGLHGAHDQYVAVPMQVAGGQAKGWARRQPLCCAGAA